MIKKTLLTILIITFFSCERDDICIEPTTPNLIILFYDNANQSEKKAVSKLKVEIESLDNFVEISQTSTDSIIIPLRIDVNSTKIKLTKNFEETNEQIDYFTLKYLREEIFVSRSCGFKTSYSETETENLTNNWINSLTINNQTIADETEKHISIFH